MINELLKKKYLTVFIIFICSFFIGILFLYIERKILGISSTFHPDSLWYLTNHDHNYISIKASLSENIINFFKNFLKGNSYYSVVKLLHEIKQLNIINFLDAYRNLILLNIFLYSLTCAMVFLHYIKHYHSEQKNYLFILSIFVFMILPYKLHLAVNILKETFIFFFLIIFVLYQNKVSLILSSIFGTSFRFSFIIYYLIFFDFKKLFNLKKLIYFSLTTIMICIFYFYTFYEVGDDHGNLFYHFIKLVSERNTNEMAGRIYDYIPNFSNDQFGYLYRSILWPLLFLSGTFIFFTDNIFFILLGIEIIIMQIITWICHKRLIINFGMILVLIIISLWVTNFTSFHRYAYLPFVALFLKIIFEKNNY